jgi:MFS family permease
MHTSAAQPERLTKRSFAIIFAVSAAIPVGNMGLVTVLPAIGRSTGIPDFLITGVFALSALTWAFCAPVWAKVSDHYGRRPLIMLGMFGLMISMAGSAVVVGVGLRHLAGPMTIFVLFLFTRSVFGVLGSAAGPASQAYIAERTSVEDRTQALSSLAGSFALGTVFGPFLAQLCVLVFGLTGPLYLFAVIGAAAALVVWKFLPEAPRERREAARPRRPVVPGAPRETPMWRDQRVAPFIHYAFTVGLCQTAQTQILGFLIIDKLKISPVAAQGFIAIAMMFGAVASLLAQWGVVRMFDMTPRQLLRWGVAVAALGSLMMAFSPDYWAVVAGFAISNIGLGLARPGFTAGASIAVGMSDQARVAGAITAASAINIIFGPAFVLLYTRVHPAPFLINAAMMLALLAYAFMSPQLRNAAPRPTTREDSAKATLEKLDEGGV